MSPPPPSDSAASAPAPPPFASRRDAVPQHAERRGRPYRTARRAVGLAVLVAGALLVVARLGYWLDTTLMGSDEATRAAWRSGLIAATATAIGTLPIWCWPARSRSAMAAMLAFSAGVMLAASVFSLLLPAYRAATSGGMLRLEALSLTLVGAAAGAVLLQQIDHACTRLAAPVLRLRPSASPRDESAGWRSCALFVLAIVLHNIPEGLSIGIGHAGLDRIAARDLSFAIAWQDLPEGLVVALAMRAAGVGRATAFTAGATSGLVEPVAAVVGAAVAGWSVRLLPWGLSMAAGAMLFAIVREIVPMLACAGRRVRAVAWAAAGLVLMSVLDNLPQA